MKERCTIQITGIDSNYKKAFDLLKAERNVTSERFMRILIRSYLDDQRLDLGNSYAEIINQMLDDNAADDVVR